MSRFTKGCVKKQNGMGSCEFVYDCAIFTKAGTERLETGMIDSTEFMKRCDCNLFRTVENLISDVLKKRLAVGELFCLKLRAFPTCFHCVLLGLE